MKFGDRIKKRRTELNMSAGELASLIGKNRATIYRYENGDIENITLDVLDPLAEALDLLPEYLLGWTDSNHVGSVVKDEDWQDILYVRMRRHHAEHHKQWYEALGDKSFTDDEFMKVLEYAKFIIYLRDK